MSFVSAFLHLNFLGVKKWCYEDIGCAIVKGIYDNVELMTTCVNRVLFSTG